MGAARGIRDWPTGIVPRFSQPELLSTLEAVPLDWLDDLDFGVIVMDREDRVLAYNADESKRSGLARQRVLGRNFFVDVGPCMNNYLVAERFHEQAQLDEQLDYVLTFVMRPTPVRLRLLAGAGSGRQYLVLRSR